MRHNQRLQHLWVYLSIAAAAALASACTNGSFTASALKASRSPASSPSSSPTNYKISNVTIGTGSGATAKLFFDAANSAGPVTDSCSVSTDASLPGNPCNCLFEWSELNNTGTTVVPIPHSVQTTATVIQPSYVECKAPSIYATEIPDHTTIQISLIPSGTNANSFTVTPFNYTKSSTAIVGSYQDAEGRQFDNILRYSCYNQFKRGLAISSKKAIVQNSSSGDSATFLEAGKFCLSTATSGADTSPECAATDGGRGAEFSSQEYYFNLYIRSTDKGSINMENDAYKCPQVKEPLVNNGIGSQNDYYPLDSSFSLALTPSPDYPIGVEAVSKLSRTGDPGSVPSSCFPSSDGSSSSTSSDNKSLITSCLGFAAKPAADGTCPTIKDASGLIRPTFRLRRFVALYPPLFDTNGKMIAGAQATDTIYVLDRPVNNPGGNPLKPFTMLGPKPCPFAYFDQKGVTFPYPGIDPTNLILSMCHSPALATDPIECKYDAWGGTGMPFYTATNSTRWDGLNVDGIEFPNQDIAGQSCSAAMPLLNDDKTIWSIGTVHRSNPMMKHVYVRPVEHWAPHYVEDTSFLACAPQANPMKDPPLHFAKDSSGNVSWCAESYPTQNPNVSDLEPEVTVGGVAPYTSHVVKNSNSATCTASSLALPSNYANGTNAACTVANAKDKTGAARHNSSYEIDSIPPFGGLCSNSGTPDGGQCLYCANQTCDRTVQNPNLANTRFPLLAPAGTVEKALEDDSSYGCTVTYDAGEGKAGKYTPTQGCCGATVQVWTGNGSSTKYLANTTAHLEPDVACQVPQY